MQFLLSPDCVYATVWMHHMDAELAYREKAKPELYRNVTSNIEQILEAIFLKTAAVWPPTFHL